MRRNVKFAGYLVKRFDAHSQAYIACMRRENYYLADKHNLMMNRLRNVLEFRYNVIV